MTDDFSRVARAIEGLRSDLRSISTGIQSVENSLQESIRYQEKIVRELRGTLVELEKEIEKLRSVIVNTEIAKIEGKKSYLGEYLSTVNAKKLAIERRFESEYDRVKTAYSKAVLGIIRKFVDSVKTGATSTRPLVTVLNSYTRLKNITNDLLNLVKKLQEFHSIIYTNRLNKLTQSKNEVITKMKNFLEYRKSTAELINSLKTDIQAKSPTVVNIPFYVVGVTINGQEKTLVLPLLERTETTQTPTKDIPYVEHLDVSKRYDFSKVAEVLKNSPDVINFAKSSAIKLEKTEILSGLNNLKERGYINDVFVEAVDKFWR